MGIYPDEQGTPIASVRWWTALLGLFLFVFALVALSGPGAIDIIDGQPRYEVARSLVEHGDCVIRNPQLTFLILPGRDGLRYSTYRLPQSIAGVAAILLADATGPVGEMRRQFFFSMIGAVACGILAVAYAILFRLFGCSPRAALGWALAGIFCTPCWFYGTSSFDDILGTTASVAAVTLAWCGRRGHPRLFASLVGLAVGVAFNCKQPLGLVVLPVLALFARRGIAWRQLAVPMGLILAGLSAGVAAYEMYEWYKFPSGSTAQHAEILSHYVPAFPGTPFAAVLVLLFSPGASIFLYCPTVFLSLRGLVLWFRSQPLFSGAMTLACAGFFGFICCLIIFKGDPSWGPRYLTPLFALLWIFVPTAAGMVQRRLVVLALGLGALVQLLALSVCFDRLYVELRFPSGFYQDRPYIYFHSRVSHLFNRPREIYELLTEDKSATTAFGPMPLPTYAPPCSEFMERGPEAVRKYRFLNSFRPWWASMTFLAPADRPLDLSRSALLLLAIAAGASILLASAFSLQTHVDCRRHWLPSKRDEFKSDQQAIGCSPPTRT
jgi:hypothetical protein